MTQYEINKTVMEIWTLGYTHGIEHGGKLYIESEALQPILKKLIDAIPTEEDEHHDH